MEISTHAQERFNERFPENDLEQELKNAVPFAGQRYNQELRLAPCGCVFAIANKVEGTGKILKTVLTQEQAIANLQSHFPQIKTSNFSYLVTPVHSESELPKPIQSTPKPFQQPRPVAQVEQIKAFAFKHAQDDWNNNVSPVDTRKKRKEELKKHGLTLSKFYEKEYFRVLTDLNADRRKANKLGS